MASPENCAQAMKEEMDVEAMDIEERSAEAMSGQAWAGGNERTTNEKRSGGPQRTGLAIAGAITFAAVLVMLFVGGQLPWFVLPWYLFLSVVSVALYAWDKSSAEGRHWRIKESTLNTLALMGGWPGAWIAQQAVPAQIAQGVIPVGVLERSDPEHRDARWLCVSGPR